MESGQEERICALNKSIRDAANIKSSKPYILLKTVKSERDCLEDNWQRSRPSRGQNKIKREGENILLILSITTELFHFE